MARAACTESVTSSIRTMNIAVSPGFMSSSSLDLAQNPSLRMSRSMLLCDWIWPYPQWWLVSRASPEIKLAVHPPPNWTMASLSELRLML